MLIVERGGSYLNVGRRRRRHDFWGLAFDTFAVVAALALVGLGALNLGAIGGHDRMVHQLGVVIGGLVVLGVFRRVRIQRLALVGWACYVVSIALILAVLAVGNHNLGVKRWLELGSLSLQPTELAKLGLLLVLADILSSERPPFSRLVRALVVASVPIGLTIAEPDLSTAMLLSGLTLAMLLLGRLPLRLLVPALVAVLLPVPFVIPLLRPYQLHRVQSFVSGHSGGGPGYALHQAHIALASGGLTGLAHTPLHDLRAQYLPGRQTDLAFVSLVEQWGLVAGAAALAATLLLLWRVALASRAPRTRMARLAPAGLAALLGIQVAVSVAGNLGAIPVAGIPFPLLSYGGAAAVVYLAAIGIALGARRDGVRRKLWAPPWWKNPGPRWIKLTATGLTGVLFGLSSYGWNLHAQGAPLRQAGDEQMQRCVAVPAPRGVITDRHGTPVAVNVAQNDVVALPAILARDPTAADRLAALVGIPIDQLRAKLKVKNAIAVTVGRVPLDLGAKIDAAHISGVMVIVSPQRSYPYGPLLGPILGFAGVATPDDNKRSPGLPLGEIVGRTGIEKQYDAVLRGVDGRQCVYVSPVGTPVAIGPYRAPVAGADLRLSLDLGAQQALTDNLAKALAPASGRPTGDLGGAVAINPQTGEVLAMASLPAYDDNVYRQPVDPGALAALAQQPGHPTLQHTTQVVAPPGSTFKSVVATADVVHGVLDPNTVVPTGASFTLGNHTFMNWKPLGPADMVEAIQWSNDVYFYKLALQLGPDRINDVASQLGVGRPTGIDLPGESTGELGSPESVTKKGGHWYPGSTVILGIGQGSVTVTPLQVARWLAAIATGRVVTPRLGLAVDTGGGQLVGLPRPASLALPWAGSLGPVREGLRMSAAAGTSGILADLGVPAMAKTGTAEDPASPNGRPDSWLMATAPADTPEFTVVSMVRGGGWGAVTSGPVVHDTLRYLLDHAAAVLAAPPVKAPG